MTRVSINWVIARNPYLIRDVADPPSRQCESAARQ